MIDINSLPTPKVVQNLDYETTLAENLKYFRAIFPDVSLAKRYCCKVSHV